MEKQPDRLWIIDAEAKTVFANVQMAEILGTTQREMMGQDSSFSRSLFVPAH
jgi:PAS domain S-box-containing protein